MGLYKDGTPGELFIRMAKEGSTVSGLMDSFATAVSLALQHGVPMKLMCEKFSHTRFEPSGFTGNPEIPIAKSIMDYIFRWLELRFVTGRQYPLFKDMVLPPMGAGALSSQQSEAEALSSQHSAFSQPSGETTPPQGGVASSQKPAGGSPSLVDRGLYHSADALKEFVDLGDAPSLPRVWRDHDQEWELLQVYELWEHVRMLVAKSCNTVILSPPQGGLSISGCSADLYIFAAAALNSGLSGGVFLTASAFCSSFL